MAIDFDALVLAPCHATFGEQAIFYPAFGTIAPVTGIFNDRYLETKFEDGIEVVDYKTVLSVRAAQFTKQPRQDDGMVCRNIRYVITNVEPDGIGDLRLSLRAATDFEAAKFHQRQ